MREPLTHEELEKMRRELVEKVDATTPESLSGRIFRELLEHIEEEQREIINERFGR